MLNDASFASISCATGIGTCSLASKYPDGSPPLPYIKRRVPSQRSARGVQEELGGLLKGPTSWARKTVDEKTRSCRAARFFFKWYGKNIRQPLYSGVPQNYKFIPPSRFSFREREHVSPFGPFRRLACAYCSTTRRRTGIHKVAPSNTTALRKLLSRRYAPPQSSTNGRPSLSLRRHHPPVVSTIRFRLCRERDPRYFQGNQWRVL